MVKAIGKHWLSSLLRVTAKRQRAAGKALGKLLAPSKARTKALGKPSTKRSVKAKAKPQGKARAVPLATPGAPLKVSAPRQTSARAQTQRASAPGKWLASHHTALSSLGGLPARRMGYFLYLPEKASAELPLVVMLHGCDQSAPTFAHGTGMNAMAERRGYAVLYPQQSLGEHPHRCWKWYDRASQDGAGSVQMIAAIIEKVARAYPIARNRIYIAGMSAGAAMANLVALHHPHLIAAQGLHSGPAFGVGHGPIGALSVMQRGAASRLHGAVARIEAADPAFPSMPTILIHGERDRVVRPINQLQLALQMRALNHLDRAATAAPLYRPGTTRSHPYHVQDDLQGRKPTLRVVRVEQLEHAWSGGAAGLPFNDAHGPNASKLMLDFFARHERASASANAPAERVLRARRRAPNSRAGLAPLSGS